MGAMKKWLLGLGLLAVLAQGAGAWRPAGWAYVDYPWAYDGASGDWYWFNTPDVQWVAHMGSGQWARLENSALHSGWSFFGWPYAYAQSNGAWHYLNESDTQWCVNMGMSAWSLFGAPSLPEGMVLVAGGTNSGTSPDYGAYSLTVGSFWMDRGEVNKALWDSVRAWAATNGYGFDQDGAGKAGSHPVSVVSWYDAVKWCNARSQKEGFEPVYHTDASFATPYKTGQVLNPYVKTNAAGYRLPTVEEWQYAARGGVAGHRFPWEDADTISHDRANFNNTGDDAYAVGTLGYHPTYIDASEPYTSPAGSFAANGYGLFDMAGNVWEWCWDWYPGREGTDRVSQGGAWKNPGRSCRIGYRYYAAPSNAVYVTGFRTVRRQEP